MEWGLFGQIVLLIIIFGVVKAICKCCHHSCCKKCHKHMDECCRRDMDERK